MTFSLKPWLYRGVALGALLAPLMAPHAAHADEQTVKLIQLLISKGILTQGQAADLLKQTGGGAVSTKALAARKNHQAVTEEEPADAAPPAPKPGEVRVTYVPNFVRKQIADEVRADVMNQAKAEGWAEPDALPEWTKRVRIYGDMRMRAEDDLFGKGNYGQFVNFPAINQGSPFDINEYGVGEAGPPPFLNTTQDRDRFRLRARIGADAEIADWLSGNIRLSTGDYGPVSTNQTMGSNGEFGKYEIYLDRAYLTATPISNWQFYVGRMNNPFFTTDMIYNVDLGFDGAAAAYNYNLGSGISVFGAGGAFPVLNSTFDFSTDGETKPPADDAYLYAAQLGVQWRPTDDYVGKLAVGIFDFDNVQGQVSSPCSYQGGGTYSFCSTDSSRPPFGQFGNTYMAIRDIIPYVTSGTSIASNPQYFGLASKFDVFEVHPRLDVLTYHPFDISFEGEFVKNFGFDAGEIEREGPPLSGPIGPQNNVTCGSIDKSTGACTNQHFVGGDTGYMIKATVGNLRIEKLWDWNVSLAYKYIESDAVLDALNDSDFHLGGTNAKGFVLGGNLGVATNTWVALHLNSASAVSGPQYNVDVIQLDINTAF